MKRLFSLFCLLPLGYLPCSAQLFSSGNNLIAGNTVGIGTNTPNASTMLHIRRTTSGSSLFMENTNATGSNTFRMLNDNANNFATFTKYGSAVTGGYTGISTLYPFANCLGFGNNGPFLNAGAGNIGFAITKNNTNKLKIHIDWTTERVGIGGNAVPAASVHVNSSLAADTIKITNATTGHGAADGFDLMNTGNEAYVFNRENGGLTFGTNNTSRMSITNSGLVTIGSVTTPAGYKLYVEGGILSEKVKVALKTSANWADYVFADDYKLASLPEVAAYIREHRHLPGIPSADEVVDQGLDLAEMDAKLLGKVEELTLHLIRMQEELDALKQKNAQLEQTLSDLNK